MSVTREEERKGGQMSGDRRGLDFARGEHTQCNAQMIDHRYVHPKLT